MKDLPLIFDPQWNHTFPGLGHGQPSLGRDLLSRNVKPPLVPAELAQVKPQP